MLILDRQTRPAGQRRLITSLARSEAEILEPPMSRLSDRYAKHFLKTSEHFLKMQSDEPCLNE
ncbi:MAG: hypothetical protein A2Y51_02130 [Gallionellales bacterium RIFCSPLOWO2_02_60_31]|nr:MAG: hypothetical protein A2Y51_02130 [Gallionellales bacterium RIFCSPLOWO2_02_60_31]